MSFKLVMVRVMVRVSFKVSLFVLYFTHFYSVDGAMGVETLGTRTRVHDTRISNHSVNKNQKLK